MSELSTTEKMTDFLRELVGESWLDGITFEELDAFHDWICKAGCYRRNRSDPTWVSGSTADAFKGFVIGLRLMEKREK